MENKIKENDFRIPKDSPLHEGQGLLSLGDLLGFEPGESYAVNSILFNVALDKISFMPLQSVDATAQSVPSTADLIMLIEDEAGTATLNTDVKAYISRDSGSNFTQGTLVDEGTWGSSSKRIVAFHNLDISGQPSGTSICYKITTHNQSSAKETRISATSYGWK